MMKQRHCFLEKCDFADQEISIQEIWKNPNVWFLWAQTICLASKGVMFNDHCPPAVSYEVHLRWGSGETTHSRMGQGSIWAISSGKIWPQVQFLCKEDVSISACNTVTIGKRKQNYKCRKLFSGYKSFQVSQASAIAFVLSETKEILVFLFLAKFTFLFPVVFEAPFFQTLHTNDHSILPLALELQ